MSSASRQAFRDVLLHAHPSHRTLPAPLRGSWDGPPDFRPLNSPTLEPEVVPSRLCILDGTTSGSKVGEFRGLKSGGPSHEPRGIHHVSVHLLVLGPELVHGLFPGKWFRSVLPNFRPLNSPTLEP